MNARISPRHPLRTRVIFSNEWGQDFLYFWSDNISSSGIFITTEVPLKSGTKLLLKFQLNPDEDPIQTAAVVTRFHGQKRGPGRHKPIVAGVGLKFTSLSPRDFNRIRDFVESGAPEQTR